MYCQNCGKEIDPKAVICVHCGVQTNNATSIAKPTGRGKGIASMILGIIGIIFCLSAFSSIDSVEYKLDMALYNGSQRLGFAIGFVLIQSIFAIIGVCLAASERKKFKNGFNASGLWLSIIGFACIAIQFIYTIAY